MKLRKIGELQTNDPQEIADLIMEEVIRTKSGLIKEDDMTVVVAKLQHNTPEMSHRSLLTLIVKKHFNEFR